MLLITHDMNKEPFPHKQISRVLVQRNPWTQQTAFGSSPYCTVSSTSATSSGKGITSVEAELRFERLPFNDEKKNQNEW